MFTVLYRLDDVQWRRILLIAILSLSLVMAVAITMSLPGTLSHLAGQVLPSHHLHLLTAPHPLGDGGPSSTCGGGVGTHC